MILTLGGKYDILYISFSHNPVREVELKNKKGGGRAMLYLRDNNLTRGQKAAIEAALAQLEVKGVREVIVVSLPDPEPEDVMEHLRHPWWRRAFNRICRPFRR